MSGFAITLALTLVAGAAGAVVRALVTAALPRHGTDVVNLAGTLLLALTLVLQGRGAVSFDTAFIVGVGFSGSLTTFSAWIGLVAGGLAGRPLVSIVRGVLLPLGAAVGLTVLVFATLGG
jgi:fluoride ion exporter CrcB/FEX